MEVICRGDALQGHVVYCVRTFPGSLNEDFVAAMRFPSVPTPRKQVSDRIIELKRFCWILILTLPTKKVKIALSFKELFFMANRDSLTYEEEQT